MRLRQDKQQIFFDEFLFDESTEKQTNKKIFILYFIWEFVLRFCKQEKKIKIIDQFIIN